jgi:putative ABC transport system permease protein
MFKNFILLAYRHFVRSPLTSFIELFGMTAGLTVFLLVLLWVSNETSYDKFNEKADRIYRLEHVRSDATNRILGPTIIAPLLKEYIPEVKKVVRIRAMGDAHNQVTLEKNENHYDAGRRLFVDSEFFDTFTFEFVAGNPENVLTDKKTVIITESLAKTIFGDNNAIGEEISDFENPRLTITGVIKDVPNFHIPFKMLISFATLADHPDFMENGVSKLDSWNSMTTATYLLLQPKHHVSQLEEKIKGVIQTHYPKEKNKTHFTFNGKHYLRPIKDIYINNERLKDTQYAIHGDGKKIVAYTSIAIFTLLLACLNFINLNNAKYFERVKEVGIKKVCGASRGNVFIQFFGEVVLLCFISLILALIFTHSILPVFNDLIDATLSIAQLFHPWLFISMIIGLAVISLASGGLPAMYLSSFQPVLAIKGVAINSGKNFNFKKINLVIQFSVTIILLIGSITAFRQVNYMKNTDLGFAKDKVSLISIEFGNHPADKVDVMKRILLSNSNILSVSHTGVTSVPGENNSANSSPKYFTFDGIENQLTRTIVDEDYKETLGLELLDGRFFEKERANDQYAGTVNTFNAVLNESAVKAIGLENPIGASGKYRDKNVRIIGVIKDFHLNSVNNPILPMAFFCAKHRFKLIVKISSNDIASTIQYVESEVEKITGKNTSVRSIDDIYENKYSDDDNFASLIGSFTALAILIACLGLLGVATHAIKLRIKEIGIRKTMGATSLQILKLITAPFLNTILISTILALPIGWILMDRWLSNYPYRVEQNLWVFGVACGLTVTIAAFTIIWQSWQASSQNPARLIRYE